MATLRNIHDQIQSGGLFAIAGMRDRFGLGFEKKPRNQKLYSTNIRVTKLAKHDPLEEELLKLREELRREPPPEQPTVMDEQSNPVPFVGVDRGAFSLSSSFPRAPVQQQPSVQVMVGTRDKEGRLKELHERYQSSDCERVIIDGVSDELGLNVHAEAFRSSRGVEMYVSFHGFTEPTRDFFKQLCAPSYDDALDRVGLSEHRIVFSTTDTQARGRAFIPIRKGINVLATLELPANLAALVDTGTEGKRLDLYGVIPFEDEDDGFLRFATAPLMTLRAHTLTLEQVSVDISLSPHHIPGNDDDPEGDEVRETTVSLTGSATVGTDRQVFWAAMPMNHELLQLRMMTGPNDRPVKLRHLDALMGCDDAWRKALPEGLRQTKAAYRVREYTCNVMLPLGKVNSILCTLDVLKGAVMEFTERKAFVFPLLAWRWVIGLPQDAGLTNIFLEGEGDAFFSVDRASLFNKAFEATISFKPEFVVRALDEDTRKDHVELLIAAFGLQPVPEQVPVDLAPPWCCLFTLGTEGIELAVVDANEQSMQWTE
jgi:hypothetical protein